MCWRDVLTWLGAYMACCVLQVLRVFHDRLISEDDKAVFNTKLTELVQTRWAC